MDNQHFEGIFNGHYPMLKRVAFSIVGVMSVAEDIATDCLMQIWQRNPKITREDGFVNYLRSMVRHKASNYLSRNKEMLCESSTFLDLYDRSDDSDQISSETIQHLYSKINNLPSRQKNVMQLSFIDGLNSAEVGRKMGITRKHATYLKLRAIRHLRSAMLNESEKETNYLPDRVSRIDQVGRIDRVSRVDHVSIIKDEVNAELIKYLARHPHALYDISAHKFEHLVAELMKDMGYDIYLTSRTRDGGRDIIAIMNTPSNDQIVTLVECKRNSPDNTVGIDIVERFIYTLREKDKANAGWIVTTSAFSMDARKLRNNYRWLLSLKDRNNLEGWLSSYGKWKKSSSSSGLWLPNNPLL